MTLFNGLGLILTLFATGDYGYIPSFWNVVSHGIGLIYAYYLSCSLSNPSKKTKVLKMIIVIITIYSFVMGSLFLVWQYNPNLADDIIHLRNYYIYGAVGMLLYTLDIYLIYYWIKKIKKDKDS